MKNVAQAQTGLRDAVLSVLIGMLCGTLFSLLLLVVFSILMVLLDMPSRAVQLFAFVSIAGGGFGGGIFAGRLFGQKGLALGVATGFFYLILLAFSGILMGHAILGGMIFAKLLVSILAGMIGGILGVNTQHRSRHT